MKLKTGVAIGAALIVIPAALAGQWILAVGLYVAYVAWTIIRTPHRRGGPLS